MATDEEGLPLPLEQVPIETLADELRRPEPTTSVGAASIWWSALLDIDANRDVLDALSLNPDAWGDYSSAAEAIASRSITSMAVPSDEDADIEYVKFIEFEGEAGRMFAAARLYDVYYLTMIRLDDGYWRVWGLSHDHLPKASEIYL